MKINKFTLILSFLILTVFPLLVKAQTQDLVSISTPKVNETVSLSDQLTIEWVMDDEQQEDIDFQISLSPDTCQQEVNAIDIIATDEDPYTNEASIYTYLWDVAVTANRQNIADGKYCLQVCGTLVNDEGELYGMCDGKDIVIITNTDNNNTDNNSPEIVSVPPNLNIKTGNKFSYQIIAQDLDQDGLYYYMAIGPDFMSITPDKGLLTSTGGLVTEGLYEVKIVVQDGKGGWDEQLFIIKISNNSFYELAFVEPNKYTVYSQENTAVNWTISPSENISSIILSYTKDGIEWVDFTDLTGDARSYDWDTSLIENGEYYLKLLTANNDGELFEVISERFIIQNVVEGTGEIRISVTYPKEDTLIAELNPVIEVDLSPSAGANISVDNVVLTINDVPLNCIYDNNLLSCPVEESLENGVYTIALSVQDSADKSIAKTWQFTVGEEISNNGDTVSMFGNDIEKGTVYLSFGILCLGVVILVVIWTIYYISKRKKQNVFGDVNKSMPQAEYDPTPMADTYSTPMNTEATTSYPETYSTPEVVDPNTPIVDTASTNEFTPEIGEQSLGDTSETMSYNPAPSIPAPVTPTNTSGGLAMPSSYSNEEIPEWLKDFESDQPVGASGTSYGDKGVQSVGSPGGGYTTSESDINDGAKVHDDYGIALNTDDN